MFLCLKTVTEPASATLCVFKKLGDGPSPRKEECVTINVQGSMHRKYIPIYVQQDATLHSLFISGNCSTCFGWYLHPPSGAHTTVSTASGTCQAVSAIFRYRGGVGFPTTPP